MQTISWWDSWILWWSGEEVPKEALIGPITVLAWGRIGKFIAFLGSLAVVLDLLGPAKLRAIANGITASSRLRPVHDHPTSALVVLLGFGIPALLVIPKGVGNIAFWVQSIYETGMTWTVAWKLVLGLLFILLLPVVLAALSAVILVLIARGLEAQVPGEPLRRVALGAIVAGFALDLLAS